MAANDIESHGVCTVWENVRGLYLVEKAGAVYVLNARDENFDLRSFLCLVSYFRIIRVKILILIHNNHNIKHLILSQMEL